MDEDGDDVAPTNGKGKRGAGAAKRPPAGGGMSVLQAMLASENDVVRAVQVRLGAGWVGVL